MTPTNVDSNSSIDLKKSLEVLEREFMRHEQAPCPVIHHFAPGQYTRELHMKAGTLAIGHHQNFEHLNVFVKGKVAMRNDDGTFTEMSAPMTFIGKPGRKIGYIIEDVIWLNVYATEETDVEKLESHFLTKSDAFNESIAARSNVLLLQNRVDQKDFQKMLREIGVTAAEVRQQSMNLKDRCELPPGSYKIKVTKSRIQGEGLFATGDFETGEVIAPARINGFRTIAGRYTNHSKNPNARMVRSNHSDIQLVAIRPIAGCHGGMDGEEITINYRESVKLTLEIGKVE